MTEVIELVRDWRLLLIVLVVFGVAPGAVLRQVVRLYPKGHPRREELIAELYAMTFVARPLWVAQQFETAIFEGLQARWQRDPEWLKFSLVGFTWPATVGLGLIILAAMADWREASAFWAYTISLLLTVYSPLRGALGSGHSPRGQLDNLSRVGLLLAGGVCLHTAVYGGWLNAAYAVVLLILGSAVVLVALLAFRKPRILARYIH